MLVAENSISEHPIFSTISNILELQKNKKILSSNKSLTNEQKYIKDYAFGAVRNIQSRINSLPEVLLNHPNLDSINSPLQQAFNELSAFISNGNVAHLQNTGPLIDQAIRSASWAIPTSAGKRTDKEIEKEISAISSAAEAALIDISEQRDSLSKQLEELIEKIAAQDNKISELSQTFEQKTAEANATSAEINTQYSKLEQTIESDFFGKLDQFSTKFDEQETKNSKNAEKLLEKLQKHERDAREIVQVVGNIGVTGNYKKRAADEKAQADFWRLVTVGLFAVGVALVVINLVLNFKGQIDLTTLIVRFAIAFAIALPAFYSARESARHRSNADSSKQTELELASLGPFMESLPEEQKVELRVKLTDGYFGNQIEPHKIDSPIKTEDFTKLLKAVQEIVAAAKS